MERRVFQFVVETDTQLRHVRQVALHHDAALHVAAQHHACSRGRAVAGMSDRWHMIVNPCTSQHHACSKGRKESVDRHDCACKCVAGWLLSGQDRNEHAPGDAPDQGAQKQVCTCVSLNACTLTPYTIVGDPHSWVRTCVRHEQVDLLDKVQEHLVRFVFDALLAPADGARHLQRRVGVLLLLLVVLLEQTGARMHGPQNAQNSVGQQALGALDNVHAVHQHNMAHAQRSGAYIKSCAAQTCTRLAGQHVVIYGKKGSRETSHIQQCSKLRLPAPLEDEAFECGRLGQLGHAKVHDLIHQLID
eukprot:361451-Chlamydomonas_euryale.AAC.5